MLDATTFDQIQIGLATTEDIRKWSYGEVKKPETINYRTLKPEKDGLFGEQIFGPTRDWECYCGKYKRVRFSGIVCERCGVEVTKSSVRRERMGHIELAAPVTHIWYFKGVPSRLGYLLNMAPKDLEKVIYFAAYMITSIDEEARHDDLPDLQGELDQELSTLEKRRDFEIAERTKRHEDELAEMEEAGAKADQKRRLNDNFEKEATLIRRRYDEDMGRIEEAFEAFKTLKVGDLKANDYVYQEMEDRYGHLFEGFMGAEAIKRRLTDIDLAAEEVLLREQIAENKSDQRVDRATKRLRVVKAFLDNGTSPASMVLDVVPVIPPELRPMVQLDGGRFATSDLNDLYRRVINRNNRLQKMLDLNAPEMIVNHEKRMLQEAVDALFDNGRRGRPTVGTGGRALKSLSDMLKGKQGRFRQNLLGKRVDYSGRSVIVVGPQLELHQCGLPKQMALELFKPFVIKRLMDKGYAQNIKAAKRMVERSHPQVWDVLEVVIQGRPVLLNRAPTLHRLGIQAFEPQLIEGKAIQLHPLVCAAFNADFDGDQMAVHLPLSVEAQAEARILMLASNNILKPSDGRPVTLPSQDMIIGLYHLTGVLEGATGEGRIFSSISEAIMAKDQGTLDLRAKIKVRLENFVESRGAEPVTKIVETTLGLAMFNELLPASYPYTSERADKNALSALVNELAERYPKNVVAGTLDKIKDAGFYWATRSGITVALSDVVTPPNKKEIVGKYEKLAQATQDQFENGLITDGERREELVEIWSKATDEVSVAMRENFPEDNTINQMVTSGARGNWLQIRNIAGIRGLVNNPKGEVIPRPILSSYREGLSVAEYFIATHGARKGGADTALRTADSGYLTRRLVDVAQDIIIREQDCGSSRGLDLTIAAANAEGVLVRDSNVENSVYARTLSADAVDAQDNVILAAGSDVGDVQIDALIEAGIVQIKVRSVLTCESAVGVCAACYGRSLATGQQVDIGEAVGIIAAQSIGEPGTQLTMRTFHTGGSASADDITQGLPRVTELFEARKPKNSSPIAEVDGTLKIEDTPRGRKITLTPDSGDEPKSVLISRRATLLVEDGQHVTHGTAYHVGDLDPNDVLRILGERAAQKYLVEGVQGVYRSQGVPIHDKHIEVIVRQMLRKAVITEGNDTSMIRNDLVDFARFIEMNRKAVSEGKQPAKGRRNLMGITKASLKTDSWLSAASFQETTRVLTEAAIAGQSDPLIGLKENVIIGKLIPAGTGLNQYRDVTVEPTEAARAERYPSRLFATDFNYDGDDYGFASLTEYDGGTEIEGNYS